MSALLRAYATKGYWAHIGRKAVSDFLAAVGALWLLTEVALFFSWEAPTVWLKAHWWVYPVVGVLWAAWENRPRLSVSCTLRNRDVTIGVRVGDIFKGDDAIVIGCNTTFDTDVKSGLISDRSLQGKFTEKFYTDSSHLDTDIARALINVASSGANSSKPGKQALYEIGTTVKVRIKNRVAYLCGFATMNNSGNTSATLDDLKQALPQLWEHIANVGDHGNVSVPILGSGLSRVGANRELLIREILLSFIAACSAQRPCSALTVVIHPADYYRYELDLEELGRFVTHLCKYTEFAAAGTVGHGLPVQQVATAATVTAQIP